jgi:hypothetical protein
VKLRARAASPTNPLTDTNWHIPNKPTVVLWEIDTNGDDVEDFVTGVISSATRMFSSVDNEATGGSCAATASFASDEVGTTFNRSCIGNPESFRVRALMLYQTATTASVDLAPDAGFCCQVTFTPSVTSTTVRPSTNPTATPPGGDLPRTGGSILAPSVLSAVLILAGAVLVRGGRRRRELEEFRILVFGPR